MNAIVSASCMDSWLDRFRSDPLSALDDLLRGLARVPPYERAAPSEILKRLFGSLSKDDPELILLDETLRRWLDGRLREWPMERRDTYGLPRFVTETMDSLAAVWLVGLPRCGTWIQDNFPALERWGAPLRLTREWDLPRALAQAMALTQRDSRLRFYWFRLCKDAARPSERAMIDPALVGLAEMPGAASPNRDLIAGLVRFGAGLQTVPGDQADFLRRWRALKVRFPRTSKTWRSLWRPALTEERYDRMPFRRWLLESEPAFSKAWTSGVPIQAPTTYQEIETILKSLQNVERESVLPEAKSILDRCERYAEATGEPYFFVRTANNFGKEVVDWAPMLALAWSRAALRWEPGNGQSWSLRGTALARLGRSDLAEAVFWEAARRLPDNAVILTQLAGLLAEKGQAPEAEALLREAKELEPANVHSLVELAKLLARTSREFEAEMLLRETVANNSSNMIAQYTLALLLIAQGRSADAARERDAYEMNFGQNGGSQTLDRLLAAGAAGATEAGQRMAQPHVPVAAERVEDEERIADGLKRAAAAGHADLLFRLDQDENALTFLTGILDIDPDALYPEVVWALHDQTRRPALQAKYQEAFGALAPHLAAAGPETTPHHWDRLRRMFPERLPLIDFVRLMRIGIEDSAVQRLLGWVKDERDEGDTFFKNRLGLLVGRGGDIDPQAPEQRSLLNAVVRREVNLDAEALGDVA